MNLFHDLITTVEIISVKSIRTLEEKRSTKAIRWLYSSLKVFFLTLIFFLFQADMWSSVSVERVDHSFVDCWVNRAIMKVKHPTKSYLWIHYLLREQMSSFLSLEKVVAVAVFCMQAWMMWSVKAYYQPIVLLSWNHMPVSFITVIFWSGFLERNGKCLFVQVELF